MMMPTEDQQNDQHTQEGFTLLEAIVALSIGVVILTTLAVAINQVTESITRTERMALQNRLLNAGIMRAMEDADSWSTMDATGFQPLRPNASSFLPLSALGNGAPVTLKIPSDTGTAFTYTAADPTFRYKSDATDWNLRGQPFTKFADVIVTDPTTQYADRQNTWSQNYRSDVSDRYDARYWQPCFKQSWYRGDGGLWMENVSRTVTLLTNATTATNRSTLYFASNTGIFIGMRVSGVGIAANTTVTGTPSTNVSISANPTSAIANDASITFTWPGTASITSGSTTVTGTGTLFSSMFAVGDEIYVNGETQVITAIASNTSLSVAYPFLFSASGVVVYKISHLLNQHSAYGNYAVFANTLDGFILSGAYDGNTKTVNMDARAIVPASHRWNQSMHKLFNYTLGWYGWFDYLPANAFLDYYDAWGDFGSLKAAHSNKGGGNNADGVDPDNPGNAPRVDTDPSYDDETHPQHMDYNYNNSTYSVAGLKPEVLRDLPDGIHPPDDTTGQGRNILWANRYGQFSKQRSAGVMPLTKTGNERAVTVGWYPYVLHVGICAPTPTEWATYGTTNPTNEAIRKAVTMNRYMGMGYASGAELVNSFPVMQGCLNKAQDLVSVGPSAWPKVTWGNRRFMKWGNMSTWCYVRMIDPISGRSSELQFPTIGTTLRGARLARGLDTMP